VIGNSGKRQSVTDAPRRVFAALARSFSIRRPWGWGAKFGVAFISGCVVVAFGWMGLIQTLSSDWFRSEQANSDGSISYEPRFWRKTHWFIRRPWSWNGRKLTARCGAWRSTENH